MPTVRKAMRGDRGAIRALYENEKGRAFAVAELLLRDAKDAESTVVQVFKGIWKNVIDGDVASDADFSREVLARVIVSAKARVERKEPAAFRFGANAVYDRTEYALSAGEGAYASVLAGLPALARLYLALRVACGGASITDPEVAKLFGSTAAVVADVFEKEREKLGRAFSAVSLSTAQVGALIDGRAKGVTFSAESDEKALSTVDALVLPMERARKKQRRNLTVAAVAFSLAVLLIVGACLIVPLFDKTYYADITIENYGTITLVLDDETAPITVRNFVNLAREGFYDGLTFHRIIEGFMMQGGDPDANGTGGKLDENGKKITIKGEFDRNGVKNDISHKRGVISMARGNDMNSASSQFFIMHQDTPDLDGAYAAFGHVISGIEIVDAICEDAEPTDNNGTIPLRKQPKITSIVIRTE